MYDNPCPPPDPPEPPPMDPLHQAHLDLSRRAFLGRAAGVGTAALATLLGQDLRGAALPGLPHFAPKAKRVIYLLQGGAPSHVDLFDHKPELYKRRGEELPASVHKGQRLTT